MLCYTILYYTILCHAIILCPNMQISKPMRDIPICSFYAFPIMHLHTRSKSESHMILLLLPLSTLTVLSGPILILRLEVSSSLSLSPFLLNPPPWLLLLECAPPSG